MRVLKVAILGAMILAGSANAAVLDITSVGAWTNLAHKSVGEFDITSPGKYTFNFKLVPKSLSEPNLASILGVNWNFATSDVNQFITIAANKANVNSNSFDSGLINFEATKAGKYLFTLGFTNQGTWNGQLEANVAPVPEPETYALMGIGLLGLLAARRRKMK